jgi:hypothetical protein
MRTVARFRLPKGDPDGAQPAPDERRWVIMSQPLGSGGGRGPSEPGAAADELLRLQAENEALRVHLSHRRTIRAWSSNVLAVLTVLALVASLVAIWARETLYDSDRFMEVVQPALDDPAFYAGLSDFVADESLVALDLETRIATALDQLDVYLSEALVGAIDPDPQVLARIQAFDRPTLSALAPSLSSSLEDRVVAIVEEFVTSEELQARLPDLVRQVHTGGVALIRGETASLPNVYTDNGEVRLDLVPVITEALQRAVGELQEFLPDVTLPAPVAGAVDQGRDQLREQLAEGLQARLPEDFGQLTMMTGSALSEVQQTARQVDRLVGAMAILALVLLGLSIAVSPARRRTVIGLALGVVAALVLTMLLVRRLEAALFDQIVDPEGSHAVRQAYAELASSLRTTAVLVAVLAILISVIAYLAGRPARITDLGHRWTGLTAGTPQGSELDRWIAGRFDLLRLGGIAAALGVVFLIGLELLPVLVIGVLLGLYLWAITASNRRIVALQPVVPVGAAGLDEPATPGSARTRCRDRGRGPAEGGLS